MMDTKTLLPLDEPLSQARVDWLSAVSLKLRGEVVELIDHAGSGHIGGSMSSLDVLVMLYATANITPANMESPDRDRVIISMGHISPAVYCVLAAFGFVDREALFSQYRREEGVFEGHPSNLAPGVEWCNGCLGQGLSQGVGTALALGLRKREGAHVYVLMGDGEQSKGQLQEAIELAAKYRLSRLTAIVDMNGQQSSGTTQQVNDVPVARRYEAAGWQVIHADGHDFESIRRALLAARQADRPVCILAHTVMGKGIPGIENDWHYHGQRLTQAQVAAAMEHFALEARRLPGVKLPLRPWQGAQRRRPFEAAPPLKGLTAFRTYGGNDVLDGRKACANVLTDLASVNSAGSLCVLDCDLASGLGIARLNEVCPGTLIECGIQEHNAASVTGGLASCGIRAFFMDFGVFALAEPFNQLRVLDQNHIPFKIIASHCGVDVGQDGKSHQFIDCIALANALLNTELILPADPNQADRALRYLAGTDRPGILALPRSNLPVLTGEEGELLFGGQEPFEYGKADWLCRGRDATILTYGIMAHRALEASRALRGQGISCGVLNVSCPKALDEEKLLEAAATGLILVAEDHNLASGLGSMVGAFLAERGVRCAFRRMGVTRYGISASQEKQFELQRLTAGDLARAVREFCAGKDEGHEPTGH